MADHIITVEGWGGIRLAVICSCTFGEAVAVIDEPGATLDELNRQAHEHIESEERQLSPEEADVALIELYREKAYRSTSAVTDPKELVSLLGPEEGTPRWAPDYP